MNIFQKLTVVNEVLALGKEDYFFYGDILGCIVECCGGNPEHVDTGIDSLIHIMLVKKWLKVGDLTYSGFSSWDLSPEKSLAKIKKKRSVLDSEDPEYDVFCWFSNTDVGSLKAGSVTSAEMDI